ncbi:MAG: hypothetical protein B6U69_03215 [Thermofilum sp. ex4484_15]|nr:MAG: hypothetical protein B6U69_03215 [Thermofilum sp. ex4484_15]
MVEIPRAVSQGLEEIVKEIAYVTPKILLTLLTLTILVVVWKIARTYLMKLLNFVKLDEGLRKLLGRPLPLSSSKLIIGMGDLGIALIGTMVTANLLLPSAYRSAFLDGLATFGRMASILVIATAILALFSFLINYIKFETKLKSYMFLISFLILTAFLIDISALSPEVKTSLIVGLSQGIGISIAIFAIWFFFGDYIKRYLEEKLKS